MENMIKSLCTAESYMKLINSNLSIFWHMDPVVTNTFYSEKRESKIDGKRPQLQDNDVVDYTPEETETEKIEDWKKKIKGWKNGAFEKIHLPSDSKTACLST